MFERLQSTLQGLGAPRIMVVGDLILDEYIHGTARRISPEAPVPVLESTSPPQRAMGGAANVAHNLVALGCEVTLCGAVGDDAHGEALTTMLRQLGVDTTGIAQVPGRPTTHKARAVAHGQHLLRIDRETLGELPPHASEHVAVAVRERAARVQGIVCSDYAKGVLQPALLDVVRRAAERAHVPFIVDPKGIDFSRYAGASVLTPNMAELRAAASMSVDTEQQRDAAAWAVLARSKAAAMLVTCGKDGMVLYEPNAAPVCIAADAREVFDVTGAGDTVIAALSLALFGGAPLCEAARLANAAAAVVVGKLGTATCTRKELRAYLDGCGAVSPHKLVAASDAREFISQAKARGRRVVFTNGCFDLLHAGHVHYLQAAKDFGDMLVVGLNTDASVRRLKGPTRPFVGQADRAHLLAALGCVDYVVLFDEPTPAELIAALVPDVLVKGADYVLDAVVGRDVVEGAGGRVELVPLTAGQSTSALVRSIIDRSAMATAKTTAASDLDADATETPAATGTPSQG